MSAPRTRSGRGGGVALAPALLLVAAALAGGGACQAIVSDAVPAYTCSGTGLGACPSGAYCKGSGCTACEALDVCDGYDNDCDGKVDDGAASDRDGDGFSFCGRVDETSGRLVGVDCDDTDPEVHPGAAETCDGKDDDCDGVVDNPGVVCGLGETCVAKARRCVADAALCSPTTCAAPATCDPDTQQCVAPSLALGAPCASDGACESGICGDAATVGDAVVAAVGAACTTTCCSSAACPSGFVCDAAGTGGRYCVPMAAVGATGLGAGAFGAACAAGPDCRSGDCEGGACADVCCADADCGGGTCALTAGVRGHTVFACAAPAPGKAAAGATCARSPDCRSGACSSSTLTCSAPCCGLATCGDGRACLEGSLRGGDDVAVCEYPSQALGKATLGEACQANADCASDHCIPLTDDHGQATGQNACTDVCCTDDDCKALSWKCRPTVSSQGHLLPRCVPATTP